MNALSTKIRAFLFALLIAYSIVLTAHAEGNYIIFGVRNEFPMSDGEVTYKDVYVNIGSSQGVKVGTSLDVYRSQPTADELNQKHLDNVQFRIAKIKVIHAEPNVAIARVTELNSSAKGMPVALVPSVMVGDQVEISRK